MGALHSNSMPHVLEASIEGLPFTKWHMRPYTQGNRKTLSQIEKQGKLLFKKEV